MSVASTKPAKPKLFVVGQRVIYRGGWGTEPPKNGKITNKGFKNGERVYGVDCDDGDSRWGYADQFEALSSPKPQDIIGADAIKALRASGFKIVKA